MKHAMLLMALALILSACGARPTATANPIPVDLTTSPTSAAAQVATASPAAAASLTPAVITSPIPTGSLTQIVTALPPVELTITPLPTIQPVATNTPLFVFTLPTVTPPATPLDCALLTKSVADSTKFDPGERFSVGWQVMNAGSATWYPGTVVFQFIGGTKMYLYPTLQLQRTVQPGETTTLSVDMRAPQGSTTYTSLWSLRQGDKWFCRVSVRIFVREK